LPNPENRVVVSLDGPFFLTVQSLYSRVAPAGQVLLYALKHLDPSTSHNAERDRAELESWLDATQPGWRNEVVEQRYLPSLVVSNALVTAREGGKVGRPSPVVPDVHNLYVAGDWVGPRGILSSASLWSAKLAARKALLSTTRLRTGEMVAA
jgi:phytoene dehydrogenase-like protein